MTSVEHAAPPPSTRALAGASALVFLALIGAGLFALYANRGGFLIEDDARYYTVIAQNLVTTGRSTFDGMTLTNGYHPLWLVALWGLAASVGLADGVIVAAEMLAIGLGVYFMASTFASRSLALRVGFASLLAVLAIPLVGRGMEISFFILGFGLFTRALLRRPEGVGGTLALGLALAFTIGARIDSAVFVLPMLVIVAGIRSALAPLAVAGVVLSGYAALNFVLFGVPFPISGAVKSLGGLQLNRAYLRQSFDLYFAQGLLKGLAFWLRSTTGKFAILATLSLLALPFVTARARGVLIAFLVGLALFLGKLVFGSSWVIWSWYGFPFFVGLFALFFALDQHLGPDSTPRRWPLVATVVFALLAGGWILRSNGLGQPPRSGFEAINELAVEKLGGVLAGAPVAMGDRAGSFAHFYKGPTHQTEGLVNDLAYLKLLQAKGDVKALLCSRGVRYYVAFQKDLGDYKAVSIPVLRRALTQYDAPSITLKREDEVGRVFDLKRFDASADDEGDSYLYVWRISDCPVR